MPVLVEEEKICPKCGTKMAAEDNFCSNCGTKYVTDIECQQCQTKNPLRSRFCRNCGASLVETPKSNIVEEDPNTFTDPRDGKTYKTVKIGNKIWMAENLAYGGVDHYCPDNDRANVKKYGYLYEWEDAKKACPPGWRLPTKEEFMVLLDQTGAGDDDSSALRDETWEEGSNSSGFGALPAGLYDSSGYNFFGDVGYFWSSTEYNGSNAYRLYLGLGLAGVFSYDKTYGFSVRCLRDSN